MNQLGLIHCGLLLTAVLLIIATEPTAGSDPASEEQTQQQKQQQHEYCIIGAGPAGLQLGYFMRSAHRDYVIVERAHVPGAFFETYPRHDVLISINKRRTDSRNTEYALRHDWNSLLSDDPQMQLRHYSTRMFPRRQDLLTYLRDFRDRFDLNVHFGTNVTRLTKNPMEGSEFWLDTNQGRYQCQVVIAATGLFKMRTLNITGIEHTTSYDQMSLDPADYEDKRVLIIGKGNAAFETAASIYGRTQLIHLLSRRRIRLAWSTHYVGDVRAVNNELLDTYQLKSIDALLEHDANDMIVRRRPDGRLALGSKRAESSANSMQLSEAESDRRFSTRLFDKLAEANATAESVEVEGSDFLNYQYDYVIRANGFEFDQAWLGGGHATAEGGKYPRIGPNYESIDIAGLYFAGTLTHSLDFRKAAGGFIHGFRYTARALHRLLEARRHSQPWPSVTLPLSGLLDAMVKRINEGSGTYQMFSNLGDVFIVDRQSSNFTLLEEFPVRLLPELPHASGHSASTGPVFVFVFEYGRNFSGPALDVFHEGRAGCDVASAHECNFLHPVVYRYDSVPQYAAASGSGSSDPNSGGGGPSSMPKPSALLHLREDVHTNFRSRESHLQPLAAFLESALHRPTYPLSLERCVLLALASGSAELGDQWCNGWNSWSASDMLAPPNGGLNAYS